MRAWRERAAATVRGRPPSRSLVSYRGFVVALTDDLRRRLAARNEVALAVLFGSGAQGRLQRGSDVDLGVQWSGGPPSDLVSLLADLERAMGRTIDLIDLDSAPPQLRFEIARSGQLLVERVPGTWSELRARAYLEWWDFAPLARRIHRAAVAQLREAIDGPRFFAAAKVPGSQPNVDG